MEQLGQTFIKLNADKHTDTNAHWFMRKELYQNGPSVYLIFVVEKWKGPKASEKF